MKQLHGRKISMVKGLWDLKFKDFNCDIEETCKDAILFY